MTALSHAQKITTDDWVSIAQIMSDYGRYCDTRDMVRLAGLFVEDATWVRSWKGDRREFSGRSHIVQGLAAMFSVHPDAEPILQEVSTHIITNPSITGSGIRATGHWNFMSLEPDAAAPLRTIGEYTVLFVREQQGWKIVDVSCEPRWVAS